MVSVREVNKNFVGPADSSLQGRLHEGTNINNAYYCICFFLLYENSLNYIKEHKNNLSQQITIELNTHPKRIEKSTHRVKTVETQWLKTYFYCRKTLSYKAACF